MRITNFMLNLNTLAMKQLQVLIVDDVAFMRRFVKYSLEKSFSGIAVDEAVNGKDAQAKLENAAYDVVVCDWEMPEMSGYEVLRWVRNHPLLSKIPFIMISARSDKKSVIRAVREGVNSYIVKPFTAEVLAEKVGSLVSKGDCMELRSVSAGTEGGANVLQL